MLDQKIRLRAGNQYIIPKIQTVRGDTGRVLVCEIEDFEIPGGATATFWAMKPSGKSVQNDVQISDQKIMVELTNQTLAEQGYIQCQIEIKADGKSVKTFAFCLDNGKSLTGDWPKSENENTYLEGVVAEMQAKLTETINQANAATSAANTATQSANTATENANAAADEARQTIWNNKNLTNSTSAAESQVETAAGAVVLTGVDGKTEQKATTGSQLLPNYRILEKTINGVTYTPGDNGSVILKGIAESNISVDFMDGDSFLLNSGKYTLSSEYKTGVRAQLRTSDGTTIFADVKDDSGKATFSITENTEVKFRYFIETGANTDGVYYPMLNEGDTALPWEQYTGSVPGPNPDYQISVQGVGGNTSDDSFGFNAVVQGYQLLDLREGVRINNTGCTLSFDGNGGIIIDGTPSASRPDIYLIGTWNSDTEIFSIGKYCFKVYEATSDERLFAINRTTTVGESDGVGYATCNDRVTCLVIRLKTGKKYDKFKIYPMFNKGDSPFDWEPYYRSELSVTLTHPFFEGDKLMQVKFGKSYVDADGVMKTADRDLWGIYHGLKYYECTGEENIISGSKGLYFILNDIAFKNAGRDKIKCNYFKSGSWASGLSDGEFCQGSGADRIVGFKSSKFSTPNDLKEYFRQKKSEGNPVVLVLIFENAYFEPFEDQTPFFGWTTPDGGCTITTDDPLNPIISADTAQTPEGSYLLTGYVEGLRARNNETVIAALSDQVVALTQKSMEG